MSWLTDLTPLFGGSVTLAGGMYGACVAAEKAARPEALRDIGRILKDPSWSRSVRASAIIERLFNWTFGERHFSWKCISRSIEASILFMLVLAMLITTHDFLQSGLLDIDLPTFHDHRQFIFNFGMIAAAGLIPDYLSLCKSRLLIRLTRLADEGRAIVLFIALDILFSALISLSFIGSVFLWLTVGFGSLSSAISKAPLEVAENLIIHTAGFVGDYLSGRSSLAVFGILFVSTLFTSVWTLLILLSTVVLKGLAPLHRFTSWFLDVERSPLQAIGIVAGALVMIGSLVWSIVRAVI
jgi:hypothetical protein